MEIIGKIMTYIFLNPENNYSIFLIKDLDGNKQTLCGYLPPLEDNLTYLFDCIEVNHPKYGLQYKVNSFRVYQDNTKEGVVSYLSSSLFPGIGISSAEAIFDTLGPNCLDLIEKDPNILNNVSKLTKKQKEVIYIHLVENKLIERIFVSLSEIGLSNAMIMKLYQKYGENTLDIIYANPYQLIYDLEGIGFKKADELAFKCGFKEDDPERLKALLIYTFNNLSMKYGLTYLSETQLLTSAYNFVLLNSNVSSEELKLALKELIRQKLLITENSRIYLPYLYYDELGIASKVNQLLTLDKEKIDEKVFDTFIKDFEKLNNIRLSKAQISAIKMSLENNISIITGGPGTGKTTIIKAIISYYALIHGITLNTEESVSEILLCAPTGKASKRIREQTGFNAKTIHSALGYNFETDYTYDSINQLPQRLIVVDESSMIDNDLAFHLFRAITSNSKIVLVGDVNQLPSIEPGAFLSDLIDSGNIPVTYLDVIYRQDKDSNIVKLASLVKDGYSDSSVLTDDITYIESSVYDTVDKVKDIIKTEIENGYDIYNDIQVLAPMYKGQTGIDIINKEISDEFNKDFSYTITYGDKVFKENDKIIQLVNSKELKIMNGDIGSLRQSHFVNIEEINKECYLAEFTDRSVELNKKDFENISLAYATSIHKSQGSEYKVVVLVLNKTFNIMLKRKLIYTAISRAKDKLYIVGDIEALNEGIMRVEDNRQTSLSIRINGIVKKEVEVVRINDPLIPFDTLGEYDMEGITPYSFMDEDK